MTGRTVRAAMLVAILFVLAPVLVVAAGITTGQWVPAAAVPTTPEPTRPPSPDYESFLDDVRAGRVVAVEQAGSSVFVTTADGGYAFELATSEVDVFADMERAATEGGVPVPAFSSTSGPGEPGETVTLSWDDLLVEVRAGRILDVSHQGNHIFASANRFSYEVVVPPTVDDVLGEIEAAAAAGGVMPPFYSKAPG